MSMKPSASASVDLPILREVAGANVAVEVKKESGMSLAFSGTQQLVFGFKCLELSLSDGLSNYDLRPQASALRWESDHRTHCAAKSPSKAAIKTGLQCSARTT